MGLHTQESHLYNNRNGFITLEHPHGAYLASKPPLRKNKDYRPRPRNSVAGFSVYKTDFHERHWYTFMDVLQQDDAPIIRYSKCFVYAWGTGIALGVLAGMYLTQIYGGGNSAIINNRIVMNNDYAKPGFSQICKRSLSGNYKYGVFAGAIATTHLIFTDWFR